MSSAAAVRGVVVAHGAMASGLVDAVRKISGVGEDALVPLSNEGAAPDRLAEDIGRLLGEAPGIVFTDMQSGSCAMAARLTCRDEGRRAVVCGANLPMLLDFVFHRELPLHELVSRLVAKGRDSIQSVPSAGADADSALSRR